MDDLQRKVSSPDRYIILRNGDLDLDPMVRRIRDLTMFGSLHERERTIPRLPLFFQFFLFVLISPRQSDPAGAIQSPGELFARS
jgi:hypothetical protein